MANKKEDITKDKDVKKILNEIDSQINNKKEEMLKEFTAKIDEQIEIGVSKKIDQLEKKILNGKNGKIFRRDIVIVILLAISIYFAYCLYEIGYFNKNLNLGTDISISENDENNTEIQEVKPASYYIENYAYLVGKMQIPNSSEVYKNGITRETLSNDIKLKIAYKNLSENAKEMSESIISVASDNMLSSYIEVMGESNLDYTNFEYDNLKFLFYNNTFIAENTIASNTNTVEGNVSTINQPNISAVNENTIIGTTSVAEISSNSKYNIINAYEKDGMLTFEITYEGKADMYKYVFEEIEGTYYFSKITK